LNCTHCFTLGNKDKYELASLEQISEFLYSIRKNVNPKGAVFYIHGGEPFLAPLAHLKAVNKIIRETFPDIKINIIPQTNLMFQVDDEFVEFIKQEYNSHIGVSWDYGIRFQTTTRALDEDLFLKNFNYLVKNNIEMAVAITVQKHLLTQNPISVLERLNGAKSIDFEFLTMFDKKTQDLKVNNKEWSKFYHQIVEYYSKNQTTWSLPQVDLLTKSYIENKIYQCKCNCCQNRTFTMNCNGTIGLCPDETYFAPFSTVKEMSGNWAAFTTKAESAYLKQLGQEINPLCAECEFFEVCGGNCEPTLFGENDEECPLSKQSIAYQFKNIEIFQNKLYQAKENLVELREGNPPCH
jgi:radical SAM protein with 4Fe4S-binding SPASM domain